MSATVPVRDRNNTIVGLVDRKLFDTLEAIDAMADANRADDDPDDDAPPAPARPSAPPPPRRRAGDTPSVFAPQPRSDAAASDAERQWKIIGAILAIVLIGFFVWAQWRVSSLAVAEAPAADAAASPTASATAAAAAELVGIPLPNAAIAYDAPNGSILGPLEPGRRCVPDHWSPDGRWLRADCQGSGMVWLGQEAWSGATGLPPTPTPVPTPTAPPPRPAPAAPVPAWQPTATPNWASLPIVGRAESPDGVLICESRISQADAERCLAELLAQTATSEE
jgi:hypothetical protein